MSTYTPEREVRAVLVSAFRADVALRSMLFPDWSPQINPITDLRVYDVHAEQRPDPAVRSALPVINVDATWNPEAIPIEQRAANLRGGVTVYVYVIVPPERKDFGSRIVARTAHVALSTALSGARIIAADLYGLGTVPAESISALNGAWQFRLEFRSAEVEVLA